MLSPATDAFIASLELPDICTQHSAAHYFEEPRGRWQGQGAVVRPRSVQEVSHVLRRCHEENVSVIPYGGGTGLVGGQLTKDGPRPVVLSLELMNAIRSIHPSERTMVVDAGCILANIQSAAQDHDLLFPLSLASEGSAQIGGLLATNAGGVNVIRYGNARALCLGLEVVRPDGSIWHGLSRLRKDNTGYNLRDLFIGSEGTLGIITAASLKLEPAPTDYSAAVLEVDCPRTALSLLALTSKIAAHHLIAFELIHKQGAEFMDEAGVGVGHPLPALPKWCVLIDIATSKTMQAEALLTEVFEQAFEQGLTQDGVIAQSHAQRLAFWQFREHIPEANRRIGSISSHDISLPLSAVPDFIEQAGQALAQQGPYRINCFGHLGDGNLHYNVFPPKGQSRSEFKANASQIKRCVHDMCHAHGGSVSAEHGVGRLKVRDLQTYGDPVKLEMIRTIKAALDPKGIMNPGVII